MPDVREGDIGAWGRSYHEMIILSGIERQRQKVLSAREDVVGADNFLY